MRRYWRDLVLLILLTVLPLLLFAPVSLGNKTLLPVDALYQFEPYRSGTAELDRPTAHNPLLLDLVLENLQWKQFLVDSVQARSLPLWNPYLFSGQPFLANGQHSALYPLTWLFFLMPAPRAFGVFIVLQLGIAGVAMYLFGRTLQANRLGAFLAGCVFQFSGFLIVSIVHPMIVAAASYLPLLLACVDLTVRRARFIRRSRTMLPWAICGAIVLGIQVLTGHAEITYFSLLVSSVFGGWRLLLKAINHPRTLWRKEVLSPAVGLIILFTLGLSLGAVQLIPLYEVVSTSFRQRAVSLQDVLGWAYPKRRLITFFIPNFFGNPTHHAFRDIFTGEVAQATINAYGDPITAFDWGIKNYVEGGIYLGILPLLLALIAILSSSGVNVRHHKTDKNRLRCFLVGCFRWINRPYVPFLTFLSLFSLGCIFGTPLYGIIYALPFFNQSHSPFRWVFPLTVAISALAGLGVTRLTNTHSKTMEKNLVKSGTVKKPSKLLWKILLLDTHFSLVSVIASTAVWAGLSLLICIWLTRWRFAFVETFVERIFWSLANAPNSFPDHRVFFAYLFPYINIAGGFILTSGIVLRLSHCPIYIPRIFERHPVWEVLLILVVLLDLFIFGASFNPAIDPQLLDYTSPVVTYLQSDIGVWRMSAFDPHGLKTFNSNVNMLYDFQDIRGYDSVFSAQYARYMGWIETQSELPYNRISPFTSYSSLDSPLVDLLNLKYVVTEEEIPLPKYKIVFEDQNVKVYENLGNVPRAFTLPSTSTFVVSDANAVGDAILQYDPRFYTIIEESSEGWIGPGEKQWSGSGAPEPAQLQGQSIISYTPNEVIIDVDIDTPSWLILTDAFYPGWKAFTRPLGSMEDQETEIGIARVTGNFRGIQLDGNATIRFKYSPNSVKVGAFISFLSGMTILFLAVIWLWRFIYREKDDSTTTQRLAKNSIAPILLTLFNRVLDFGIAALTLRILGPQNAGDYYLAISVFVWFDIVTNFGLNTYLTREVSRHRDQARRYLFNTTAIRFGLGIVALPLLGAYIGLRQTILAGFDGPASSQLITSMLLLYVGLLPNSISTGLSALFYAFEKAEYPAATTSISTLLKATFQVIALIAGFGIIGLAGTSIIVNIITLIVLALLAWQQIPELHGQARIFTDLKASRSHVLRKSMVQESWPLMLNHLLANSFYKVDVFLMDIILGSVPLGLYSIGYKLLDALVVIPSMFTLALFPIFSQQAQDNDKQKFVRFYRLGTKILVTLALPAAIITTLLANEMVLILGGREYIPGAVIVLQLIAWSMPLSWFNGLTQYVLIALDQQRFLTRAYIWGFCFSFCANLILMPRFGYKISAILHVFSELVLMIAFLKGIGKNLGNLAWWKIVGTPVRASVISGLVGLLLSSLGRGATLAGFLVTYPILLWLLKVLTPEEQALLVPRWRK